MAVLSGFLLGLGSIQYSLALLCGGLVARLCQPGPVRALNIRLIGAMVAGASVLLTLETVQTVFVNQLLSG